MVKRLIPATVLSKITDGVNKVELDNIPMVIGYTGNVVVENFGIGVGDRISGTFTVSIYGEQDVCNDEDCEDVPVQITGTIKGRFDGIIAPEQNAQ